MGHLVIAWVLITGVQTQNGNKWVERTFYAESAACLRETVRSGVRNESIVDGQLQYEAWVNIWCNPERIR